jgi:hypothetical protein
MSLDEALKWVRDTDCELLNGEYFPTLEEA